MKLNWIAGTVVLATILSGCQKANIDDMYVEADIMLKNGNADAAVVLLKSAIQQSPESLKLRDLLGEALYSQGELAAAEKEFSRSNNHEMLLISQFHQGKYEDVVLQYSDKAENASDVTLILSYLSSRRIGSNSEKIYNDIRPKLSPEYVQLIDAFAIVNEDGGAELLRLIESSEDSFKVLNEELVLNKTRIIAAQGNVEGALKNIEALAKRWANSAKVAFVYVDLLVRAGKFERANKVLMPWLKQNENNPWANLAQSSVEVENNNYVKAMFHIERAIQAGIDTSASNAFAGGIAKALDNKELAYKYLVKANELEPGVTSIMQQLAETQLQLGYFDQAENLILAISQQKDRNLDFIIAATNFLDNSEYSANVDDVYTSILQNEPENRDVLRQLAASKLNSNLDAIPTLQKMLEVKSDSVGANMMLIQAHLKDGNVKAAKHVVDSIREINPTEANVMDSLIALKEEKYEAAILSAEAVLEENTHVGALRIAALSSVRSSQYEKALHFIKMLVMESPDSRDIARDYIFVSSLNFAVDDMENGVLSSFADRPSTLIIEELARFFFENKMNVEANTLLKNSGKLTEQGNILLLNTMLASGELDNAEAFTTAWIEKNSSVDAYLSLAAIYEIKGEYGKVVTLIDEMPLQQQRQPKVAMTLFNAYIKINQAEKSERAIKLMEQGGLSPSIISHYKGQRSLALGQVKNAQEQLSSAYAENPNFGNAIFLAKVFATTGEPKRGAKILLESIGNESNTNHKKLHSVAEYMMTYGFNSDAINIYKRILGENESDHAALNNIANVYLLERNQFDALSAINKALSLQHNTHYFDTLGQIEFASGNGDKAVAAYRKALALSPTNREAAEHLSKLYLSTGDRSAAAQVRSEFGLDN